MSFSKFALDTANKLRPVLTKIVPAGLLSAVKAKIVEKNTNSLSNVHYRYLKYPVKDSPDFLIFKFYFQHISGLFQCRTIFPFSDIHPNLLTDGKRGTIHKLLSLLLLIHEII